MVNARILNETVVAFSDCKTLPGSPTYHQIYNWSRRNGLKSQITSKHVKLEWCVLGNRAVTSREAVERFYRKLNGDGS